MKTNESRLMTTRQLANMLGLKKNTIEIWRHEGKGPPFLRVGNRTVRYDYYQVLDWMEKVNPAEPQQEETKASKKVGDYEEYSMPKMNMRRTRFNFDNIDDCKE